MKVDLVTDATYQGELLRQKLEMEAEKRQLQQRIAELNARLDSLGGAPRAPPSSSQSSAAGQGAAAGQCAGEGM
jgi:hypothetical protein